MGVRDTVRQRLVVGRGRGELFVRKLLWRLVWRRGELVGGERREWAQNERRARRQLRPLEGATGHQDSYFFTDPTDGSMTFWDPESGVTTQNSDYPRCELREMTASGAAAEWPSSGTNTLSATVKATIIPSSVAVGQIHLGTGTPVSTKPLLELFYHSDGAIFLYIEQDPAGGSGNENPVGNVPLGTRWSYVIGLSGNTITLVIDGGATQSFAMSSTYDQENMYFKAGDYDQTSGTSTTIGAKVQFYSLKVFHGE
jgi:hypothetical protein